uniref:hypothetical protein n=1 Tax=Flavobacterium sp. TaxID=239 RepID=UPI00404729E9
MGEIAVFDWTISKLKITDKDYIIDWCNEWFKTWVFQEELSDGQHPHWQGRGSLHKRRTVNKIKELMAESGMRGVHMSPTHNGTVADKSFKYVMKADTRVDGPWSDKDPKPQYIPRQVREVETLWPWQEDVCEILKQWDPRSIHCIVDTRGQMGKTILVGKIRAYNLGRKLPFCNDYLQIMRMVMDLPTNTAYIIDIPRAISKEKLFQMWGAIEEIKNGYAYDDRYCFKEKIFDSPQIVVFMNKPPDMSLLSDDRWKLWTVTSDHELVPYNDTLEGLRP